MPSFEPKASESTDSSVTLDLTIGLKSSYAASSAMLSDDDDGVDGGAQDVDIRCRRPAASP